MIEPSDTERAELPECSAKYIEDLEIELENIATELNRALKVLSLVENKLYPVRIQLKDAHKEVLKVIGQNDFYKTDEEIF